MRAVICGQERIIKAPAGVVNDFPGNNGLSCGLLLWLFLCSGRFFSLHRRKLFGFAIYVWRIG
jgi:hypothetical protein